MKKIILFLLISVVSFAEEIPSYMRDGVITVKLKNGKIYTYSTNEWKVVRRGASVKALPIKETSLVKKEEPKNYKNRVRLLGGVGPTGVETSRTANSATMRTVNGAVGGIGYDRNVTDEVSIGGQVLTNETYLLDVGLDF